MSKINPKMLHIHPGQSGKIAIKAMATMHGISTPEMAKVTKADLEPQVRSALDLSTEELGYFLHNGKVINIIFPR